MAKYQMQYHHGGSSYSYKYFENGTGKINEIKQTAVEEANKHWQHEIENPRIGSFSKPEPVKTIQVKEYSNITKSTVPGGLKFSLRFTKGSYILKD